MINFKGVLRSVFFSLLIIGFLQAEDGDVQTSEIVRQYVYEFGVDEMVLIRDVDERGEELSSYFIHQNTQGSVSALSLSNGDVIERYEYGSYGDPKIYDREGQVQSESQVRNSYFYTNRRFDEETGLYYFRHRYLDPQMGRFISRDPLGTWADGFSYGNAYSYVGQDPLNKKDPFGLLSASDDFDEVDVRRRIKKIVKKLTGEDPLTTKLQEDIYFKRYERLRAEGKSDTEAIRAINQSIDMLVDESAKIKNQKSGSPIDDADYNLDPNGDMFNGPREKGSGCKLPELSFPPHGSPNEKLPKLGPPIFDFGKIVMPLPPREEGQIKLPDLTHPAREPQFEDLVVGGSYAGDGYISEGEFPLEVHIAQSCLGLLLYKVRFPLPKGTPKRTPRPVGGSTKAGSLSGSLQGASLYPYPPGRKGGYPEGVLPPGSEDNINSGFGTLTIRTGP